MNDECTVTAAVELEAPEPNVRRETLEEVANLFTSASKMIAESAEKKIMLKCIEIVRTM